MEIVKVNSGFSKIDKISQVINAGGTVVMPFDTVYGLIADPTNQSAMEMIYKIKGRDFQKPIALVFDSLDRASEYGNFNKSNRKYIKDHTPGKYTFITKFNLSGQKNLSSHYQKLDKIGIRIPDFDLVIDLIKLLNKPIAATSANVSGEQNCWSASDFITQIKENKYKPDLVIDCGLIELSAPSKVIDLEDSKIIRN